MYGIIGRMFFYAPAIINSSAPYFGEGAELFKPIILYYLFKEWHKGKVFKLHPLLNYYILL